MNQGHFRAYGKPVTNIYINDKKLTDWLNLKVNWNGMGDVDSFEIELQWDISDTPREEFFFQGKRLLLFW